MNPWIQAAVILAVTVICFALGYLWPVFALPAGQLALLLLWALAPWWVLAPMVAIFWILLYETFGPAGHLPYAIALLMWTVAMIVIGPWWRAGRGWLRPAIITPFLFFMPWLLMRLLVSYSPFAAGHLGWAPPGLLSLAIVWGTVLAVRFYEPRRRTYRLGVHY